MLRMKMKFKRCMKLSIVFVIIIAMSFWALNLNKNESFAASQNITNYKEAKAYLDSVQAQHDEIMKKTSEIYNKVEQTTKQAFEAQKKLTESQLYLNNVLKYEYQNSTMFSILVTIASSQNLDDLFKNIQYANEVMDYQFNVAKENEQNKAHFDDVLNTLNSQNAQQNEYLNQASKKISEAQAVLESIKAKLTPDEIAELEGRVSDIGGGGQGGGDPAPTPTPTPTPDPGPTPGPGPTWSTGIASAYGGSSDPSTPNPGRTATGDICDDWSTGVAVPMAWPNYRQYFHHTVQISWNGRTVIATINDCGSMGGGSRSLDLQPGVFKAFGFQTCQAWGIRQVNYLIM